MVYGMGNNSSWMYSASSEKCNILDYFRNIKYFLRCRFNSRWGNIISIIEVGVSFRDDLKNKILLLVLSFIIIKKD